MIAAASFWDHPATIGLLIAIPSVSLGWLAYRRSKRSDETAAQSGTITQVYTGLDRIIAALQADNADLRSRLGKLDQLESDVRQLRNRVSGLERFIRDSDLPVPKNGTGNDVRGAEG